jgi:hypothetical protein
MHYEYRGHLHIHTSYSDGSKLHADIADDAIAAGLDFIIVTDHNVWVDGLEGYYGDETGKRTLLLVGEEVHDARRRPPGNHCLVFGADQEVSPHAFDPQALINTVNTMGGFCFLAHPYEIGSPLAIGSELEALDWESWDVEQYAGLEIWNYLSEFKSHLTSKTAAIRAALRPELYITGPFKRTLDKWDELLSRGRKVCCIAGGDIHGGTYSLGRITREVFPYEFQFRALNTHILTSKPLSGELEHDKKLVLTALRRGNAWVGYDAAGDTAGFRFSAQGLKRQAIMGEEIQPKRGGATFQVTIPSVGHIRLLCDGEVAAESAETPHLLYRADQPGAYRVEVFTRFASRKRGWIYSNPIYLKTASSG